jgi:hypothetical protein
MTAVSNTFQTQGATGNREDLSDLISNISPVDAIAQNAFGKSSAEATLFEWQTDSLAATDTTNGQIEGDDISTFEAVTATTRVKNYVQISRKTVIISGTQEVVSKAGRKSELSYQMVKKTKELKRDIEAILTSNQASTAGGSGAAAARRTGGLRAWIATNDDMGSGGSSGGYSNSIVSAATDGTQRALTETLLKNVLRNCFTQGGDPNLIMVGPFNKQVISGFTGNNTRMQDTSDGRIATAIDVYKHDFGVATVKPNRHQRDRDVFVLETSKWKVAYLRPMFTEELAKTGDAEKRMIVAEWGLRANNEAASGCIADVTTS